MKKTRICGLMEIIEEDIKNDAKEFDGKPFNGNTVAEYFSYHGAAIAALANTIKLLEERICVLEKSKKV